MGVAQYLADKSALARIHLEPVRAVLVPLMERGLVSICGPTELELLFSARNLEDRAKIKRTLLAALQWTDTPDDVWERAIEVQEKLTIRGQHRSAGIADLVVAVTAHHARLTVLHYDNDFDTIAAATGQPTQWVVPAGKV
ncbi:PIN domain nuclease [Longispora albida]|uniref:PIN domain nuclease n=1 Tax=Longispora albida TaxID=203523 RepID=UPI000365B519|nr:PIN domain nuclease [Longispora albida]